MSDRLPAEIQEVGVMASVVSVAGFVAVALSCIGIVGLVAYTVSQRMKEIAIRMVLGAVSRAVVATLLAQFRWPVTIGICAGVAIAAAGSKAFAPCSTAWGISIRRVTWPDACCSFRWRFFRCFFQQRARCG